MAQLTIGPFAKKCGVNVETVRYYHRRELLTPPPKNLSGYRLYSDADVERIAFIKGAQVLGFTLKEIAELLFLRVDSVTSSSEMKKRTAQKISAIEAKIRSLEAMKAALITLTACCKGEESTSRCPILDALGSFAEKVSCCRESK